MNELNLTECDSLSTLEDLVVRPDGFTQYGLEDVLYAKLSDTRFDAFDLTLATSETEDTPAITLLESHAVFHESFGVAILSNVVGQPKRLRNEIRAHSRLLRDSAEVLATLIAWTTGCSPSLLPVTPILVFSHLEEAAVPKVLLPADMGVLFRSQLSSLAVHLTDLVTEALAARERVVTFNRNELEVAVQGYGHIEEMGDGLVDFEVPAWVMA